MALASFVTFALLSLVSSAAVLDFSPIPYPNETAHGFVGFTDYSIDGVAMKTELRPLLESGKSYPSFVSGQMWKCGTVLDIYGKELTVADTPLADPDLARDFDRTTFMEKFGKLWMITQNEDGIGNYYLALLTQSSTGVLSIAKAKSLNLGGIWGSPRPCAGFTSPWNTHIAGEEFLLDARDYPTESQSSRLEGMKFVNRLSSASEVNPYWYSYPVEISITKADGSYSVGKRLAMGRANWETIVCFNDKRTCLMTDDVSSGGVLTLFVASSPANLRRGRLFGALPKQLNAADGGSFTLSWVPLNMAPMWENTVKAAIQGRTFADSKVKFNDLFETATVVAGQQPPAGFRIVNTLGGRIEWLKLKSGMRGLASCLETVRMTAYYGGSVEFTKVEGITFNYKTKVGYLAFTSIRRSMEDLPLTRDFGGPNAVRLPQNIGGAVHKFTVGRVTGVSSMAPVTLRGILTSWGWDGTSNDNNIHPDAIASPDNVDIMVRYNKLLIGEDCGSQHVNNQMWAYDLETGKLDRLAYSTEEAEVTSPYYFPNFGKFSYITGTQQHPRSEELAIVGYFIMPYEK